MKFVQTGTARENYLEEKIPFKLIDQIDEILIKKLDYLIGFILRKEPDNFSAYIENLTSKYHELVDVGFSKDFSKEFEEAIKKFKNLNQHQGLKQAALRYLVYLLQINAFLILL